MHHLHLRRMLGLYCSVLVWVVMGVAATDPYIIFGRKGGVDRVNMDGSNRQEIIALENPRGIIETGVEYDHDQDYLFYQSYQSNRHEIRRCSLSGGQNDQLVRTLTSGVFHDFQVDRRLQKIYRVAGRGRIFSEDYDGSEAGKKSIVSVNRLTDEIAVAPTLGKLFWTHGRMRSIVSSDLDGSDIKPLIPGVPDNGYSLHQYRRALAVDEEERKLYFATAPDRVNAELRTLNLDTNVEETFLSGLRSIVLDMWLHDDHLYFSLWDEWLDETSSIMRVHKSGSGLVAIISDIDQVKGVAVVQPPRTSQPVPVDGGWSPWSPWSTCSATCGNGNRGRYRNCDNPVPAHGGSFCVGPDTQTRRCNNEPCASYAFFLFVREGGISRANLDGTEAKAVLEVETDWRGIRGLDYDPVREEIYYAWARQIRRCELSGEGDEIVVQPPGTAFYSLALRPDIQSIYTTEYRGKLRRFGYDGTYHEDVRNGAPGVSFGGFHDIVISQRLGKIFFTAHWAVESIWSVNLSDGGLTVYRRKAPPSGPEEYSNAARGLAVDEVQEKIYFGVNPDTYQNENINNELHVIDMNTMVETTLLTGLYGVTSLQLYKGRLYFSQTYVFGRIQSCDTSGNDLQTHFEDYYSKPKAIKIVAIGDPVTEGPWSDWSVWTTCTETCGDGIRTKTRTCTSGQCDGQNYEIQDCNEGECTGPRPVSWEERKNKAVCTLFTAVPVGAELFGVSSALPASFAFEDEVISCKDECALKGMVCSGSLRLYPSPARRLAQEKKQVHVFERCNTKWANVCCCLN